MTTVQKLYEKAFYSGKEVQMKEQLGEEVDGRAVWNALESTCKGLKDQLLVNHGEVLQYNFSLKPIYEEMNHIIKVFAMDKSEFNPKSNHFFCQLVNLVDKKSNFEIKLNKIMQLGFNAGQLSIFLERNTLPKDRNEIILDFVVRNNMLELNTYVNAETQEIINSTYLHNFNGGKYKLKRQRSRQNKSMSKRKSFRLN
jgi:hypothetical protein